MSDPLNAAKKFALQSPRKAEGTKPTVPPKLFELGTNHAARPKVRPAGRPTWILVGRGL